MENPCCGFCHGKLREDILINLRVEGNFDVEVYPCETCGLLNLIEGAVVVARDAPGEKDFLYLSSCGKILRIPVGDTHLRLQEKQEDKEKKTYLM